MKGENRHTVTDELLFRYFSGGLSSIEKLDIEDWSNLSVDNKNKLENARVFYLDTKALSSTKKISVELDIDAAWQKIKSKNMTNKPFSQVWASALKYAASVLIVLFGLWLSYDTFFERQRSVTVSSNVEIDKRLLNDGTNITLNKNSRLSYPESFDKGERKVSLEGEAYFDVASQPDRPFLITTQGVQIKVLGTSFNVDSRPDIDSIVVTVDTGKVILSVRGNKEVLTAGSVGVYVKSSQALYQKEVNEMLTHNFWRTKTLVFKRTKLPNAIHAINRLYGTNIQIGGDNILSCKISVEFKNEELENIIDIISATLQLDAKLQDGQYVLTGNGCD